jgi:hypothetical protein
MIELPVCQWRSDSLPNGLYPCGSPKIIGGRSGVDGEVCKKCSLANHEDDGEEPGQIKNFGGVIAALMASLEVVAARLETCSQCEFYENARCKKCGCGLAIRLATTTCPIGKWER